MFAANSQILVVDDFPTVRQIVMNMCRELGFTNFTEASNITDAYKILSEGKPKIDLVLCDWNMPGGTGLDLLLRVRKTPGFEKLPFLLVTTENEKKNVLTALKAGASHY